MAPWKKRFLLDTIIFRFHVKLGGGNHPKKTGFILDCGGLKRWWSISQHRTKNDELPTQVLHALFLENPSLNALVVQPPPQKKKKGWHLYTVISPLEISQTWKLHHSYGTALPGLLIWIPKKKWTTIFWGGLHRCHSPKIHPPQNKKKQNLGQKLKVYSASMKKLSSWLQHPSI